MSFLDQDVARDRAITNVMGFAELLGNHLRQPDGSTGRTRELLYEKEVVALYFAAEWCGPCKKFTANFSQMYHTVYKEKGMEVVFVSADCDNLAFAALHNEMPWLAMPFSDRARKDKLTEMCKIKDLPALVLFTPEGEIYNYDARKRVNDPEGFPWIPRTIQQILNIPLIGPHPNCTYVHIGSLTGRYIGLYFAANWCNPCKEFGPKLMDAYREIKNRNPMKFEIIYVSSDTDAEMFTTNFRNMPWLALPWEDRAGNTDLKKLYDIQLLPSLVILDKDTRAVINHNAKECVENDFAGYDFPWEKKKAIDRFQALVKTLNEGGAPLSLKEKVEVEPVHFEPQSFPWFVKDTLESGPLPDTMTLEEMNAAREAELVEFARQKLPTLILDEPEDPNAPKKPANEAGGKNDDGTVKPADGNKSDDDDDDAQSHVSMICLDSESEDEKKVEDKPAEKEKGDEKTSDPSNPSAEKTEETPSDDKPSSEKPVGEETEGSADKKAETPPDAKKTETPPDDQKTETLPDEKKAETPPDDKPSTDQPVAEKSDASNKEEPKKDESKKDEEPRKDDDVVIEEPPKNLWGLPVNVNLDDPSAASKKAEEEKKKKKMNDDDDEGGSSSSSEEEEDSEARRLGTVQVESSDGFDSDGDGFIETAEGKKARVEKERKDAAAVRQLLGLGKSGVIGKPQEKDPSAAAAAPPPALSGLEKMKLYNEAAKIPQAQVDHEPARITEVGGYVKDDDNPTRFDDDLPPKRRRIDDETQNCSELAW